MIEIPQEIVDLYDPNGRVQQERLARLIVAILAEDPVQSVSVFTDCALDPRGERTALVGLVSAAVVGLAGEWFERAGGERGPLLSQLRKQLLMLQEGAD